MNRPIVALEALGLALGTLALAVFWAFSTPSGMNLVLERLVGDAPFDVTIENAALAPTVGWSPSTWRVIVSGIDVAPHEPDRPSVHIARLTVSSPELLRAWLNRDLRFADVSIVGLDVHAKHQHEPTAWTPHKTALDRFSVDEFDVWDASVRVDADGPLAEVDLRRVDGHVTGLVYEPATRAIFGVGSLSATSLKDGGACLVALEIPKATATGHHLEWTDGTFTFGGGKARLDGAIDSLDDHPTVLLKLKFEHVDVGAVVASATGNDSPLQGRLSADLDVHAGGALERGKAWAEGTVALSGASVMLAPDTKQVVRRLLKASSFVEVNDNGHVLLEDLTGTLKLQRGRVDLIDLRYHSPRRELDFQGVIDDKVYDLNVKLLPRSDDAKREGVGLNFAGVAGSRDVKVRLLR